MKHELVILADKIDWDFLYKEFAPLYCSNNGRAGINIRLMTGASDIKGSL